MADKKNGPDWEAIAKQNAERAKENGDKLHDMVELNAKLKRDAENAKASAPLSDAELGALSTLVASHTLAAQAQMGAYHHPALTWWGGGGRLYSEAGQEARQRLRNELVRRGVLRNDEPIR